jgi:hypothetical protein
MNKLSNRQKVINMLSVHGECNNLYCLKHGIWRLSDIIFRLKGEGWQIGGEFLKDKKGKQTKVFNYYLPSSRNNGKN